MRGAQPVPEATAPPLPRPLASDRDDSPATIAAPSVGRALWYAKDYFAFLHDYAPAAYAGDGRAAYYIWNATLKCWAALELRRRHGTALAPDQEACVRLEHEDPFAALPPFEGGYTWRSWKERAISAGDPLALLQIAAEERQAPEQQRAAINAAMRSGDPEVYYHLGGLLPNLGGDFVESVGWQLVACELGYDCRMDNPHVGMGCVEAGYCTSGQAVAEKIRDAVREAAGGRRACDGTRVVDRSGLQRGEAVANGLVSAAEVVHGA